MELKWSTQVLVQVEFRNGLDPDRLWGAKGTELGKVTWFMLCILSLSWCGCLQMVKTHETGGKERRNWGKGKEKLELNDLQGGFTGN